jgi:hypothetical protein
LVSQVAVMQVFASLQAVQVPPVIWMSEEQVAHRPLPSW